MITFTYILLIDSLITLIFMLRQIARAREISQIKTNGVLTICQTGKIIKRTYYRHNIKPEGEYYQKINLFQKLTQDYLPIILLTSIYLAWWNFFLYIVIYYSFMSNLFSIFILFVLDHERGSVEPYHVFCNVLTTTLFLIDMLLIRWRCEYVQLLPYQRKPTLLAFRYLKYYFVWDLLVLSILILDMSQVKVGYFKLCFYLKFFLFCQIQEQIFCVIKGGNKILEILLKLIAMFLFITFWSFLFSCIYITINLYQIQDKNQNYYNGHLMLIAPPTLGFINLYEHFDWYVWFQYSLFSIVQLMRGAGMGVPSPQCPEQVLWYCLGNVTILVVFSYFTKEVMNLVSNIKEKRNIFFKKLMHLIDLRNTSALTRNNFRKYRHMLEVSITSDIESFHSENKLSTMLSSTLQTEFNFGMKQHFILSLQFLRHIVTHSFSEELFRIELSQIIKSKIVYQNQVLYTRNQITFLRIYLAESSELIVSNEGLDFIEELPKWSLAGIRQFFIDSRPQFDVVANQFSTIQYIEKEEFKAVLRMYPMIRESYCELIDKILIERTGTESIELPCYHCGDYHLSEDCHRVAIDKSKLISLVHLREVGNKLNSIKQPRLTNHFFQGIPFFRSIISSIKIKKLSIQSIESDQYKRRGFHYLNYNIQNLVYRRKEKEKPIPHTDFKKGSKNYPIFQRPEENSNETILLFN